MDLNAIYKLNTEIISKINSDNEILSIQILKENLIDFKIEYMRRFNDRTLTDIKDLKDLSKINKNAIKSIRKEYRKDRDSIDYSLKVQKSHLKELDKNLKEHNDKINNISSLNKTLLKTYESLGNMH